MLTEEQIKSLSTEELMLLLVNELSTEVSHSGLEFNADTRRFRGSLKGEVYRRARRIEAKEGV